MALGRMGGPGRQRRMNRRPKEARGRIGRCRAAGACGRRKMAGPSKANRSAGRPSKGCPRTAHARPSRSRQGKWATSRRSDCARVVVFAGPANGGAVEDFGSALRRNDVQADQYRPQPNQRKLCSRYRRISRFQRARRTRDNAAQFLGREDNRVAFHAAGLGRLLHQGRQIGFRHAIGGRAAESRSLRQSAAIQRTPSSAVAPARPVSRRATSS